MDIWNILGIHPTTDKAEIKRAYAVTAKQYHPEEHPQEFSDIRTAYKAALKYASLHEAKTPEENPDNSENTENILPVRGESINENNHLRKKRKNSGQVQDEVRIITADFIRDKTEAAEDLGPYDFENIGLTSDEEETALLKKEFWNDFYAVIWHPYLRNEKMVWEYFFSYSKYRKLFKDPDFCELFMWNFSAFDNIWNVFTVRYIDKRIGQTRNDLSKFMPVTAWKRLLSIEPSRDILMYKKCCTKKEKGLFDQIWKKGNRNIFVNHYKLEEYLKSYFWYVSDKRDMFEKIFSDSVAARRRKSGAAAALAVFSVIALLVLSVSDVRIADFTKTEMYVEYKYNTPDDDEKEKTEKEFDNIFETYNNWLLENSE